MLVLSEIALELNGDMRDVTIVKVQGKEIQKYDNQNVEVIVCCRATAKKVSNMNFPDLKLIQLTSAGFDGVPIEQFAEKGVLVANAGDVYSVPMAETVVYGMLQMAKRYHANPKKHRIRFARNYKYITEMAGKTATILGTGNIGGEIAKRLQGFDMNIYGYSKTGHEKPFFVENTNKVDRLKQMLSESDYVISTLPETKGLKGFINSDLLSSMKSNCILLNVGRKSVINDEELYIALKKKKIGGAVLDMFEKVPNPVTNKFRRLSNVIVWPGVSAISREIRGRLQAHVLANIFKIRDQELPACIVNGGKV